MTNKNEQKKVPELRFPEFSGEWEEIRLIDTKDNKERYSFTGGPFGSDLKSSDYTTEGVRIIQLQNIGDGYFDDNYKIYTSTEKAMSLSSNLIYPNEIIIAKMAHPLARATILPKIEDKYLMASDGIRLKIDDTKFDNYFIYSQINSEKFRKKAEMNSTGTTRKRIGLVTLGNLGIYSTNINEQQKIGEFFSKLDRQIELEEKKLALLEEQKKGYMQKIFSQELRFKDENGEEYPEWEITQFNKFLSVPLNQEKNSTVNKDKLLSVKLKLKGITKINQDKVLSTGSTVYYQRKSGQFIYGKQNFFNGSFYIIDEEFDGFYSSGDVPSLNINNSVIDNNFFLNYIGREVYYKNQEKYSSGTGSKRIHEQTLLGFEINLPCMSEQKKIASFLEKLNKQLKVKENKIAQLNKMKFSLLQLMVI